MQRHDIKVQTEWDQIDTLVYERLEQRLLDARPCPIYLNMEAGAQNRSTLIFLNLKFRPMF